MPTGRLSFEGEVAWEREHGLHTLPDRLQVGFSRSAVASGWRRGAGTGRSVSRQSAPRGGSPTGSARRSSRLSKPRGPPRRRPRRALALPSFVSRKEGSHARLGAAFLLLFFTRSVFQWPFLVVLLASLLLIGQAPRQALTTVAVLAALAFPLLLKQRALTGMWTTSSFQGLNAARSIGLTSAECSPGPSAERDRPSEPRGDGDLPADVEALDVTAKLDGSPNFNHRKRLLEYRTMMACYPRALRARPMASLLESYMENLSFYLQPSSQYSPHALVDRLPWRTVADQPLSSAAVVPLLALALIAWVKRSSGRYCRALGLSLPVLFVLLASVLFEKGENNRFKFFLEPCLWVFLAGELAIFIRARASAREPPAAA